MRPLLFYATAVLIVIADQVSKWVVLENIPYGVKQAVIPGVLYLTHTRNTGGAFSLFQARNSWFILIAIVAMAALSYAYHRSARRDLYLSGAIALALGGAVGNLIDRVRFGYVVDFFDIQVWPIFNVADSAITVGILVLAISFLFRKDAANDGGRVTEDGFSNPELTPQNPERPSTTPEA